MLETIDLYAELSKKDFQKLYDELGLRMGEVQREGGRRAFPLSSW